MPIAATALIVLPLYAMQLGTALTPPLTAQIIRALGPVFVFALESFDGRLHYSAPVLACILAYSAFVIAGNVDPRLARAAAPDKGLSRIPPMRSGAWPLPRRLRQ